MDTVYTLNTLLQVTGHKQYYSKRRTYAAAYLCCYNTIGWGKNMIFRLNTIRQLNRGLKRRTGWLMAAIFAVVQVSDTRNDESIQKVSQQSQNFCYEN